MFSTLCRLFPNVNIITEMNDASNMRFMHFQADDRYTQEVSRLEKVLFSSAFNIEDTFNVICSFHSNIICIIICNVICCPFTLVLLTVVHCLLPAFTCLATLLSII